MDFGNLLFQKDAHSFFKHFLQANSSKTILFKLIYQEFDKNQGISENSLIIPYFPYYPGVGTPYWTTTTRRNLVLQPPAHGPTHPGVKYPHKGTPSLR